MGQVASAASAAVSTAAAAVLLCGSIGHVASAASSAVNTAAVAVSTAAAAVLLCGSIAHDGSAAAAAGLSSGWQGNNVLSGRRCWAGCRPAAQHVTAGAVGGPANPARHMKYPGQQEPGGALSHVQEHGGAATAAEGQGSGCEAFMAWFVPGTTRLVAAVAPEGDAMGQGEAVTCNTETFDHSVE
jgi:hypothetical protein